MKNMFTCIHEEYIHSKHSKESKCNNFLYVGKYISPKKRSDFCINCPLAKKCENCIHFNKNIKILNNGVWVDICSKCKYKSAKAN